MKALVSKFAAVAFSLFASVSQAGVVYNWVSTANSIPSIAPVTARIEFVTSAWQTGSISFNASCNRSFCFDADYSSSPVLGFTFLVPTVKGIEPSGGFQGGPTILGDVGVSFSFHGETVVSSNLHFDYVIQVPTSITMQGGSAFGFNENCALGCQRSLAGFWQVDRTTIPNPGTFPLVGACLGVMALARRRLQS